MTTNLIVSLSFIVITTVVVVSYEAYTDTDMEIT